ncbi:MAG: sigma-54 dependent transcriptional regulator [Deltaproteobacteria bacterium]|nr:sigma-54 dependent transcriptional regulator [Deltaproteobacteria bacterium]
MFKKIIVVEDEENMRFVIVEALKKKGCDVEEAASAEEALGKIEGYRPDLVIVDIRLPGMSGLEAMERIKGIDSLLPIIVITAFGSKEMAWEAIKMGAYDFFTKPFKLAEMEVVVDRALEKRRLLIELRELKEGIEARYRFGNIIAQSGNMREVLKLITRVAGTDATVLIAGESGTGKELAAEAIHHHSRRREGALVKLNCAAIPEGLLESELFGHERGAFTGAVGKKIGKFELADQGTIFLDEIGDMGPLSQAKVLRVLQEKTIERVGGIHTVHVDARVIAATNKNLSHEVREKRFREDLYFRLNTFPIVLPPLRERKEDIPLLTEQFLKKSGKRAGVEVRGISHEALDYLRRYDWPGNVRELENCIERAVIMAGEGLITPVHLPPYLLSSSVPRDLFPLDETLAKIEKEIILEALQKSGGVQSRAAKILGISERSLWHRVKKHRIDIQKYSLSLDGRGSG